jgi:hypothetical protein
MRRRNPDEEVKVTPNVHRIAATLEKEGTIRKDRLGGPVRNYAADGREA